MKSDARERFAATMAHETPGRIPLDLCATSLTGMSEGCRENLARATGISSDVEAVRRWAGTDFRSVGHIMQLTSNHSKRISETDYYDCWGIHRKLIGSYWEFSDPPLAGATTSDLMKFDWPSTELDADLLSEFRDQARKLAEAGEHVVIGEHPVYGILELGCWMCGYDDFLMRLLSDKEFVHAFFERILEMQLEIIEQYYGAIGEYIDLTISGDDFGMQTGPLMSVPLFRELVAPYFAKRIQRTKEIAGCYYWHHSCGSVYKLMDEIIECGVDILNPIQTSAADMHPIELKEQFGDRIVFWGAVDVQDLLRTASPDEIRIAVRELVDTLGRRGGYVVSPAHNIQDDVPPENVIAMVEEVKGT